MNLQFEWGRSFDQLLYNTLVIADLDRDGVMETVETASGFCPPSTNCSGIIRYENRTLIRYGVNGSIRYQYNHTRYPETDPAVGNLDSDSNLEIAVGENRHVQAYLQSNAPQNAPWEGRILLLNHDASLLCSYDDSGAMQDIYSSPVIADLDNDGTNDVLFGTRDGVLYVVYYSGSSTCSLKWKKDLGDTYFRYEGGILRNWVVDAL